MQSHAKPVLALFSGKGVPAQGKQLLALFFLAILASSAAAQYTAIGQSPERVQQQDIEKALQDLARAYGQAQGSYVARQVVGAPLPSPDPGFGDYQQPGLGQQSLGQQTVYPEQLFGQMNPFLFDRYAPDATQAYSAGNRGAASATAQPALPPQLALTKFEERVVNVGEIEVFEVRLRNNDAGAKNYELHVEKSDASLKAEVSEAMFLLQPGEERVVRVVVEPGKMTRPGPATVKLVAVTEAAGGASPLLATSQAPRVPTQQLVVSLDGFSKRIVPESIVLRTNRMEYDTGSKQFKVEVHENPFGGPPGIVLRKDGYFLAGGKPLKVEVYFQDEFQNAYGLTFELVPQGRDITAGNAEFKAQVYQAAARGIPLAMASLDVQSARYSENAGAGRLVGGKAYVPLQKNLAVGTPNQLTFYAEDGYGNFFQVSGTAQIDLLYDPSLLAGFDRVGERAGKTVYEESLSFRVAERSVTAGVLEIAGMPSDLSLKAGETVDVEVTVRNPTETFMKGIELWLENADGLSLKSGSLDVLQPKRSAVIKASLTAAENVSGKMQPVLVAESVKYRATKPFGVTVAPKVSAEEKTLIRVVKEAAEAGAKAVDSAVEAATDEAILAEVNALIERVKANGLKQESVGYVNAVVPGDYVVQANVVNSSGEKVAEVFGVKQGGEFFVSRTFDGAPDAIVDVDLKTLKQLVVEHAAGESLTGLFGLGTGTLNAVLGVVLVILLVLFFFHARSESFGQSAPKVPKDWQKRVE